jgi:hypothetical protein
VEEERRDLGCHDNSHEERKTALVAVCLLTLEKSGSIQTRKEIQPSYQQRS